ncbi:MAG: hypothetical protein MK101_02000 [Phycisphaerales bacterium]|nr:hypothetical protein [Phycisphaerales bacterium]
MAHITTWTALLAHWTDMARMARAIDQVDDGPLQQALPHLITCQALSQALPEVPGLPLKERAGALDLARAMLHRVDEAVEGQFSQVPGVLLEARQAAQDALSDLHLTFCWTLIWEGEGPLQVPALPKGVPASSDEGTLLLALAGTVLLPGTPVGWWVDRQEPMLSHFVPGLRAQPLNAGVQVWRVLDTDGRWARDLVLNADVDGPEDATPLLAPRVLGGARFELPDPVEGWVGAMTPGAGVVLSWPQH